MGPYRGEGTGEAQTESLGLVLTTMLTVDRASLCGSVVAKNPAATAGDAGSIPRWGRSSGEGNGTPLQSSCLENPTDRGAWPATVHGVAQSRTRLSDSTTTTYIGCKLVYIRRISNKDLLYTV